MYVVTDSQPAAFLLHHRSQLDTLMASVYRTNGTAVNDFVQNVRRRMSELGWSISTLATEAEVGRPYLSKVLSGKQKPSMESAEKIGKPLGLKVKTVKM